jgi:hypothetical protein
MGDSNNTEMSLVPPSQGLGTSVIPATAATSLTVTADLDDEPKPSESLATVGNYDASSLLFKLQTRGINPLRPETLAIIEFLPLAIAGDQSESSFNNLNFGSDAITSNVTNAGMLTEVQRIVKETSHNSIISLIEKESGMKIKLMKEIIEYFILVLNATEPARLAIIFRPDLTIDELAQRLVEAQLNNNTGLLIEIPPIISIFESKNIKSPSTEGYFTDNKFSINNKLNFLEEQEVVKLKEFLKANISNIRIQLLARCALMQAMSTGVVRGIKNATSVIDNFIKAVYLGDIVNPELTISDQNFSYGDFLQSQSYDLSQNPLKKIGITLESSTTTIDDDSSEVTIAVNDHSLSYSNNYIFLNVIGGLICELLFFNDKDETLENNQIHINSESNKGKIFIGRNSTFNTVIRRLMTLGHTNLLDRGNRFNSNLSSEPLGTSAFQIPDNNLDEIFSFCIFNEIVGDNIYIKGKNIIPNYKNQNNYSLNSSREQLLSQFINNVLMNIDNSSGTQYPEFVSSIDGLDSVLEFENPTGNNILGSFANHFISYRTEFNPFTNQLTTNSYMPLETSRGIYDFDLNSNSNLIPVEDAYFNNIINDPEFNESEASELFSTAVNFGNDYIEKISDLSEDIINLFGIGYDLNQGTISEIAEDSKENVVVPGVTPLNYLNYYLEGISKDLSNFLSDINHDSLRLAEWDPDHSALVNRARGSILSLAMILSSETPNDREELFQAFYFNDRTINNHLKLPQKGWPEDSYDNLYKQYREQATAATDSCFERLFSSLSSHDGLRVKFNKNFSVGSNGWSSYVYHENVFQDIYKSSPGSNSISEKIYGYNEQDIVDSGGNYPFVKSKATKGPTEYIRAALTSGMIKNSEGLVDYNKTNPKACIQVGGSFYQRLINTPILYTNINPHAGSSDGLCSAAIEAGNKDSQDYKENRFKNNTGYYFGNSNTSTTEKSTSTKNNTMGGVGKLSHIQKCFAIFNWYVNFLKNTIGIKMQYSQPSLGSFKQTTLQAVISQENIIGTILALEGISRENINQDIVDSYALGPRDLEFVLQSFDNATEQLDGIRSAIKRKKRQITTKLNILASNALDIKKETNDIIEEVSGGGTAMSPYIRNYLSNYSKNFIISRDAVGNATKYYHDHLAYLTNSFPFSKYDKREVKEYKRMYQVLSSKGYNLLQDENLGKKNILTVGIPAGLIDTLSQQAYAKTGDEEYLNSTLIAIYLHRTNELSEEESVYPRPFIFDTAKYISNINSKNNTDLIPKIDITNELEEGNFSSNQGITSIVGKTKFLLSDRNQPSSEMIGYQDNGFGINSMNYNLTDGDAVTGINYPKAIFQEDVCINHLLDHNLKLYQNLLLDLELENYNFLLDNEALYTTKIDDSIIVNQSRDSFRNFLFAYYPSFNVDDQVKNRVAKAISNYDNLIFNNLDEKLKQLGGGFIFDRVFSIPYSDRDFIIKADDYDELYGTNIPFIRASSKNLIKGVENFNNVNKPVITNYALKINNNDLGTIYKFFVTVNILKRW